MARLMRENGLKARMARRFKYHRHRDYLFAGHSNLLLDQPAATAPNQVWVGDVELHPGTRKVDVHRDRSRTTTPAKSSAGASPSATRPWCEALLMAVQTSPPDTRTIFHSDQGSEYASKEYRTVPRSDRAAGQHEPQGPLLGQRPHGILRFGSLKTEMVYFQKFQQPRGRGLYHRLTSVSTIASDCIPV